MNEIYIGKHIWDECIDGFNITDCAVRSASTIALCLRKNIEHEQTSGMWDHDIETRLFLAHLDSDGKTDDSYGCRFLTGYNKPRLGVSIAPLRQALLVARNNDGQVSVMGGGQKYPDEFIDPGKVPMTWRVKTIGGYAYSVGGQRSIYKRVDIGRWQKVGDWPPADKVAAVGFRDMDAFSDSDMYAVGGHGDVWHFDGSTWRQMGFPTNEQLGTVTCAGDGNVYITSEGGSLWVGQKSTWRLLEQRGASVLWNDALWFERQLWLASDNQFRVWDGKALQSVLDEQGESVPVFGHMDARDGLLAIASPWVVMTFDGQTWRKVVAPYKD